jgi:short-subunit dehydrogenase
MRSTVPSTVKTHTIVVTGASSGIGRALALAAARERFRVLLVARRADRLEAIAAEIRANGGTCATLAADVTASGAAQRIVDAAVQAFGRIDVVVNNAGAGALGNLLEIDDAAIDAQWQLHVAAPLRIARAALPLLREAHGQLVFVGSGLARVPIPNYGAYAAAKAAIRATATQLRRELKRDGIAVTYVDPGLVATEFHAAMGTERGNGIPAADPAGVAQAILRGINRRSAAVSGVLWQTLGTVIGEWSGTLADNALIKMAPTPSVTPSASEAAVEGPRAEELQRTPRSERGQSKGVDAGQTFESALEPVARRMERVKLTPEFVRQTLVPDAEIELNEVAMRWAGMPNKNERAAMREVLDALAAAGYLHPTGDETWKVLRAAD